MKSIAIISWTNIQNQFWIILIIDNLPTSLHCPWDFTGKNTGVGCHFLLQFVSLYFKGGNGDSARLKLLCGSVLSHARLCDPLDFSLPGSSVHGIFQATVLEWFAISFSRGSSRPRDWTQVSRIVDRHFTTWATREASLYPHPNPVQFPFYHQSMFVPLIFSPFPSEHRTLSK